MSSQYDILMNPELVICLSPALCTIEKFIRHVWRSPIPPVDLNQTLQLAAIDLGSNSFRLEVGRADGGQIYVLDSLRSNVRLAAGLGPGKRLDAASQERGLEALSQFAQRIAGFDPVRVRAVATNTLRVAKNAGEFIARAERVLGFPVEVIAGREEARLIFSGVAHSVPVDDDRRLVVDIGGGSTEFSVGSGLEPGLMESLYLGSIHHTLTHFAGGFIDEFTMKQAELAARRELQVISSGIMASGWRSAIASSGTARTIGRILRENQICETGISAAGMRWLRKRLLAAGRIDRLELAGLKPDRALNLPGGFAIMAGVFAELRIEHVQVADNALRLGVLYDLLSRLAAPNTVRDKREDSVAHFEQRYRTDKAQSARVASLATRFAHDLQAQFLNAHAELPRYIDWAARLHETGLTIAHNGYHKHSAYIIANADMPGFSRDEQKRLATLILGHNGKLPKLAREPVPQALWLAVACLRLAALVHRGRRPLDLPDMHLALDGKRLRLHVDEEWLRASPLTEYSLDQERKLWHALGDERPFAFSVEQAVSA